MMSRRPYRSSIHRLIAILFLISGCDVTVEVPLTNPHDPESSVYVPVSPGSLVLTAESDTAVGFQWEDASTGEDGFIIEEWLNFENYTTVGTAPANAASYRFVTPLHLGEERLFRVAAVRDGRRSTATPTKTVSFTMNTPARPTVTFPTSTSCTVGLPYITYCRNFVVERSVNGGAFLVADTVAEGPHSYTDTGLDTLSTYAYRFKAITRYNQSAVSPAISIERAFADAVVVRQMDLGRSVHSIVIDPTGTGVMAAGAGNALKIWDLNTGALIRDLSYAGATPGTYPWPYQCTFSRDGSLIAAHCEALNGSAIRIWNAATGAIVKTLQVSGRSFAIGSDNTTLYIGGFDGKMTIRNIPNDSTTFEWLAHGFNNDITMVRTVNNGAALLTGSYGASESAILWETSPVTSIRTYTGCNSEFYSVSADEKLFNAGATVRSIATGTFTPIFSASLTGQTCFTAGNTFLIEKKYEGSLSVFTVSGGALSWSKTMSRADNDTYPAIAASPSAPYFVAASPTLNKVDVWVMRNAWRSY